MGTIQPAPKATLSLTLQRYSKSIQHEHPASVSEYLSHKICKATLDLFEDLRLKDINPDDYDSPQSVYVEAIIKGDGVKLGAIAKYLSYETCSHAPSIRHLLISDFLKEENVIILFTALISQLSAFFDKPTTQSAEELAWMLFDDYVYLSIEDFILFYDLCKRKTFVTNYQHVSSRGVNADFLQDWLRQYVKKRQEKIKNVLDNFRTESQGWPVELDELGRIKVAAFKEVDEKLLRRRHKIDKLRSRRDLQAAEKSDKQKLVDGIAEELYFADDYCLRPENERMQLATSIVNDLTEKWEVEFYLYLKAEPDEKINEQGEKEVTADSFQAITDTNGDPNRARVPALSKEKYVNDKIRQFLKDRKKKTGQLQPENIFRQALEKYAQFHQIKNGKQLYQLVEPECRVNAFMEPGVLIPQMAIELTKRLSHSYGSYADDKLNKEEPPLEKPDYMRKRAQKWAVLNCYVPTAQKVEPDDKD